MTGNCGGEVSHCVFLKAIQMENTQRASLVDGVLHVTTPLNDRNQSVETKGGHVWKFWVCPTESGRATLSFRKSAAHLSVCGS